MTDFDRFETDCDRFSPDYLRVQDHATQPECDRQSSKPRLRARSRHKWCVDDFKQRPKMANRKPILSGEVVDPCNREFPIIEVRSLEVVNLGTCIDTDITAFNPRQPHFITHVCLLSGYQQLPLCV